MNLTNKRIWALLDERQGNTSQTLGVAEALETPFEVKKIEFNEWIRIPNILLNHNTLGLTSQSRELLSPPWPDIVLSTARRLGIVASYIKSQNPSTFIAQIQWPGFPSRHFDLIAAPKHDNAKPAPNLFVTVGAPHRVTPDILASEAAIWQTKMPMLNAPKIAVLVGGDAGSRRFEASRAKEFARMASALAQNSGGSLYVTTSRRTSASAAQAIKESITVPHYLHLWDDANNSQANPFYGMLGIADAVVVTGDSISMCSEACATGKPVYIYATPDFVSPKHQQFIDELYRLGLAKPLEASGNMLFTPPFRLDDAKSVAREIIQRYNNTAI